MTNEERERLRELPAWIIPRDHLEPAPLSAQQARLRASLPPLLWQRDLESAATTPNPWIWHGYLAAGNVTLLTSQWKSGKTTLLAVLLARLKTGGALAGLAVAPARVLVLSEESPDHWRRRQQKLDFGPHVCWLCRPFLGKPTTAQWRDLLDFLAELHSEQGINLVVIDPLAAFLPGRGESDAGVMLELLMPLQRLTALGMSVLVLHHPRKGATLAGQAARGSGALSGYADILIEMEPSTRSDPHDRRRRLRAFSRHEETPAQLVIELNAEGTDYLSHGDCQEEEFTASWRTLRSLLAQGPAPRTQRQLLEDWPADQPKPADITLWKWLTRATQRGLVCRQGTGHKNDPYQYWLAEPGKK